MEEAGSLPTSILVVGSVVGGGGGGGLGELACLSRNLHASRETCMPPGHRPCWSVVWFDLVVPLLLCTRRWEVREFIHEAGAAGAVPDMVSNGRRWCYYSAYWRGALYVRQHDFVIRISSSKNTYWVINLPKCTFSFFLKLCTFSLETDTESASDYRLGKSKKGVYCALVVSWFKLWIWFLEESCDKMEWIPRKEVNLEPLLANLPFKQTDGPWRPNVHDMGNKAPRKEDFECDSDDNISGTQEATNDTEETDRGVFIVGLHPSKEIVFLLTSIKYMLLAYHLNSSKM